MPTLRANRRPLTLKAVITMAGQMKISSFFSRPLSTKSNNTLTKDGTKEKKEINKEHDEPVMKKIKVDEEVDKKEDVNSSSELSVDEKEKVEAKMKMLGSKTSNQITNFGPSWFKALENELSKNYLVELCLFVSAERKKGPVYPPAHQVFTWTTACDIDSVKVVIIGQDPYHGPKQAHGLCFSVLPGIKPPPSLVNMYKELESSIEGFKKPDHGNLTGWATQGVLLLNACLTVRGGAANSHAGKGWEKLTDAAIHWLNSNSTGIVFMLWGAYAQKKGSFINKKKHHILTSVHPSPLSAHRGFLGCGHFAKCNELLKADGRTPIDWTHLPRDV